MTMYAERPLQKEGSGEDERSKQKETHQGNCLGNKVQQ
jgi:hypothetical protein